MGKTACCNSKWEVTPHRSRAATHGCKSVQRISRFTLEGVTETLFSHSIIRIEQIGSQGHASVARVCYDQAENEFVPLAHATGNRGWRTIRAKGRQEMNDHSGITKTPGQMHDARRDDDLPGVVL